MQYISGRRINQDFGVPGITTNDTVVNVDGRIAVGIGTSATTDIDTNQIRIRDNIIDSRGVIGSMGYFLTKDVEGVTWTNVPPLGNNSIFLAEDGDILNNIGLQTYTGLNIISDQLLGITTNPDNPGFADIRIDPRWFRDRTPGGGGGIYTTGTVGIGLTQPRLGPVGVLTDVKLDVLGDAIFTGVVSATSFTGEFNVNTQDLNVSGIASFNGTTDNVIGDTNTGIVQINGGVGIDKNVSIGASLDVNNLLTVGSAVTIGNGAVIANTGDFINLELDNLNVIGFSTFGNTARFNSAVNIFDDLFVSGNISVGGTGVTLDTETIRIEGKELLIGFTTTITPNDTTANAGGIAVASTEGYFLADLQISGINTTPNTYKQFKWFKSGAFVGQSTDAFITNQPISIGRTQIQNGQLFAVGNSINFTEDQITAPTFVGNLTGTASTASFATTAFTLDGRVESEFNVATAVTATNLADAANITTGTISDARLGGPYTIDIVGSASTASFATTAFSLNGVIESNLNVATAVTATNLADAANITTGTISDARLGGPYTIDIVGSASTASFATTAAGIASDVNIFTTGIATIGTVKIASGIVTATTGVVTYYGDGSNLTGINPGITSISISSNVENQSQYLTYATSIGNTTGLGVTTGGLTFNPSTGRMGIGATSPVTDLHILSGTSSFSPVTNFDKLVIENQNGGQGAVLQLVSPNKSEIGFSDATRNAGLLSYDHNTNAMHFDSNNVARATIDSNGNLGIGTNTPTNAVATSNTKILNVGVVTANNYYGSGANLTNLTGASAATYGNATNVAQVVVDANGRITGISNVAISGGGTNGVTIENNGSSVGTAITTINFSSNVTATASGSIATITSSGGGGGDTYQFNTGVTSSISLAATGVGITALTLPSTAGKQYTIYSINASNVATGNTEVNFIGAFDFSGGERSYFAYNLPVPTGLSIEALKQPQILNPSDRITIRSTDFVRNGADDIIDVYITYKEETSSDYFGVGIGTVGIAVTTNIGIYTSSTYPSVVQSIRLANRTDVGGKPISVAINNGIRTTYLIDNLIVPKYASIELLETPKRLSTNDVIEVQVDETECIDIQISGKKITS